MKIRVDKIQINKERREVDESKVEELAGSIKTIGLINPIIVKDLGDSYRLIAGMHRLESYKLLRLEEIEATVIDSSDEKLELIEIDENLIRNEIHFIDRGNYLNRREEILQRLGLRANRGHNQYTKNGTADSAVPLTTKDMAKEIGISQRKLYEEKQIAKDLIEEAKIVAKDKELTKEEVKRISKEEPDIQRKIIDKLVNGQAKNHREATLKIKRDEVMEKIENKVMTNNSIDLYNTKNKYRIIYADPPWSYGNNMPEYFTEQRDHYSTMELEEICNMPVKDILEDNAVLFLWVTSPILEESFKVIKSWGFKYKSSFVWDKAKHNMGHYNSVRHEFLLIATKGSSKPDIQKLFDSVQSIERTVHSEKPEEFREIIDTIYPLGNRVELFARKTVKGWDAYGNEI